MGPTYIAWQTTSPSNINGKSSIGPRSMKTKAMGAKRPVDSIPNSATLGKEPTLSASAPLDTAATAHVSMPSTLSSAVREKPRDLDAHERVHEDVLGGGEED